MKGGKQLNGKYKSDKKGRSGRWICLSWQEWREEEGVGLEE